MNIDINDIELEHYISKVKKIEEKIAMVYINIDLNKILKEKYNLELYWINEQYNKLITWQITEDIYSDTIYNLIFR